MQALTRKVTWKQNLVRKRLKVKFGLKNVYGYCSYSVRIKLFTADKLWLNNYNLCNNNRIKSLCSVNVITVYSPNCLGQETAKRPCDLGVKIPPAQYSFVYHARWRLHTDPFCCWTSFCEAVTNNFSSLLFDLTRNRTRVDRLAEYTLSTRQRDVAKLFQLRFYSAEKAKTLSKYQARHFVNLQPEPDPQSSARLTSYISVL